MIKLWPKNIPNMR